MIKAILACDEVGGVSKDGTLPWPKNSTDLKWFKENTAGHVVVMGSTTWADPFMPTPLPKRINIVASSNPSQYTGSGPDAVISGDLNQEVLNIANKFSGVITWVIGGPSVVSQTLDVIDEFYISRIPGEYDCDTHLPLDQIESLFELTYTESHPGVTFEIWKKRK